MGMSKQEELKKLIDYKLIKKRVNELANEISDFYKDQNFLAIGILKGSLFFLSDLTREINNEITIETVRITSYSGKKSKKIKNILKTKDLSQIIFKKFHDLHDLPTHIRA